MHQTLPNQVSCRCSQPTCPFVVCDFHLRLSNLSEKYGNESTYKEKQEDANAMAHSVQVQQQHYVKVD